MRRSSDNLQVLDFGRAGGALVVGALAGAGLVTAGWLLLGWLQSQTLKDHATSYAAPLIIFVLPFAFLLWLAGLVIVGAPTWVVLHKMGYRSPWHAVLAGAVLTVIPMAPFKLPSLATTETAIVLLGMAAIGACVGRLIHGFAYRRKVSGRAAL